MAVFVVEFPGFLVQMVGWGLKKVPKKFEDCLQKLTFFFTNNALWQSGDMSEKCNKKVVNFGN